MDQDNNRDTTNQGDPELSSSTPSANDINPATTSPFSSTPEAPVSTPAAGPVDPLTSPVTSAVPAAPVQPAFTPEQPVTTPEPTPSVVSDPVAIAQPTTVQTGNGGIKKGPMIALIVLVVVLVGALIYWFVTK